MITRKQKISRIWKIVLILQKTLFSFTTSLLYFDPHNLCVQHIIKTCWCILQRNLWVNCVFGGFGKRLNLEPVGSDDIPALDNENRLNFQFNPGYRPCTALWGTGLLPPVERGLRWREIPPKSTPGRLLFAAELVICRGSFLPDINHDDISRYQSNLYQT